METFTVKLFFGLPLNATCEQKLAVLNPQLLLSFVQEGEHYLQMMTSQGIRYIGKYIDDSPSLTDLELLEANIYSLLKKLFPSDPIREIPLELLACKG